MTQPIITFTGVHGAGKTELATALSLEMNLPIFPSVASDVHASFGVTPAQHVDFALRLEIQKEILIRHAGQLDAARAVGGIFDRSALDMAAYLLCDVHRNTDPALSIEVADYVRDAMATASRASAIIEVRPHGAAVKDRGADKADRGGPGYAKHHEFLVAGMVTNLGTGDTLRTIRVGRGSTAARLAYIRRMLAAPRVVVTVDDQLFPVT